MLKHTISYTDFNDVKCEETLYFNLSKTELVELTQTEDGGIEAYLDRIVAAKNGAEIIRFFKKIVLLAYGERSEDGKRFVKTDELRTNFEQSAAFDELIGAMLTQTTSAIDFVNGLIPADLRKQVDEAQAKGGLPQDFRKKQ